eukprot:NODE_3974_length_1134_cov_85.331355_g3781_i0.p1 GENE.NODE_3974_length_1134_cov_85.331355_g3781_i0~~NODE_3974_length_1134_cov_85.331355_g3781_i0.p1  ORF type:complete len:225 (+),score=42.65 NODE_3974_length_1134_cov_85.331355_g3781_i0:222-896(+)
MADFDPFSDEPTASAPSPQVSVTAPKDDLDFFLSGPEPTPVAKFTQQQKQTAPSKPASPPKSLEDTMADMLGGMTTSLQKDAKPSSSPSGSPRGPTHSAGHSPASPLSPVPGSPARGGPSPPPSLKSLKQMQGEGEGKAPSVKNTNNFFNIMNHYELLGVARSCTPDQLKQAYKQKAIKLHPDRNPNQHDDDKELFKRITDAYEILSDQWKRIEYDQRLRATGW